MSTIRCKYKSYNLSKWNERWRRYTNRLHNFEKKDDIIINALTHGRRNAKSRFKGSNRTIGRLRYLAWCVQRIHWKCIRTDVRYDTKLIAFLRVRSPHFLPTVHRPGKGCAGWSFQSELINNKSTAVQLNSAVSQNKWMRLAYHAPNHEAIHLWTVEYRYVNLFWAYVHPYVCVRVFVWPCSTVAQ